MLEKIDVNKKRLGKIGGNDYDGLNILLVEVAMIINDIQFFLMADNLPVSFN